MDRELLLVGCFTTVMDHVSYAKGEGISLLSLDRENGELKLTDRYSSLEDPSYIWVDQDNSFLSITNNSEGKGCLSSFYILQNRIELHSNLVLDSAPFCHIYHSNKTGRSILSSYNEGRVVTSDGTIIQFTGTGPNINRQEAPHIHQAVPSDDEHFIYCPDLGTDTVWILKNDKEELKQVGSLKVPPGYGPRHMVIGDSYAYILCELIPRVVVAKLNQDSGELEITDDISSVTNPDQTISNPAAIKLHPSGKTLVVSNRFDDTIGVISIKTETESPKLIAEFSSMGKTPREISFNKTGEWLLIANQDSDDIQLRAFDRESGKPEENWGKTFKIGSPVAISSFPTSV